MKGFREVFTITKWTGREARILRETALRMTVRDFATYTHLSAYAIRDLESKGENANLRASTQRILDQTLASAPEDAKERFAAAYTPSVGTGSGRSDRPTQAAGHEILNEVDHHATLATDATAITATAPPRPGAGSVDKVAAQLIGRSAADRDQPTDHQALQLVATSIKRQYQDGQYQAVLAKLPGGISAAQKAEVGDLGVDSLHMAADIYQTTCSVLLKLGDNGLALLAADRCTTVAQRSGDPVTIGASARALVHALAGNGHAERAVATAVAAAHQLHKASRLSTPAEITVYGALLLRAAVVAAERENRYTAQDLLAEAREIVGRLTTDYDPHATYFCAQNVRLHQVGIAVRLGDAGHAIDHARKLNPDQTPLAERRAAYFLDLAKAFTLWGKFHQAYEALREAEEVAVQEIALRRAGRELVNELQQRCPPSLRPPVQRLVGRIRAVA